MASAVQLLQTDKADVHTELKVEGDHQSPAEPVPELPDADQPGAGRDAGGVPERPDGHAGAVAARRSSTGPTRTTTTRGSTARAASTSGCRTTRAMWRRPRRSTRSTSAPTTSTPAQGMAGGAAITLVTKSGTNDLKGSAFYFRNQDELNARAASSTRPSDSSISKAIVASIGGGTVGGPIRKNRLFFFGVVRGQLRARQPLRHLHGADRADAQRRLQRGDRRSTRTSASTTRRRAMPTARAATQFAEQRHSGQPDQQHCADDPGRSTRRRTTPARTTACRTTCSWSAHAEGDPRQLRREAELEPQRRAPDLGQVLDHERRRHRRPDLFSSGSTAAASADTNVYVYTFGHTWTLGPTMVLDGNFGINQQDQTVASASDFGTNYGTDVFGIPGTNGPDPRQSGHADVQHRPRAPSATRRRGHPLERHERSYTFTHEPDEAGGPSRVPGGLRLHPLSARSLAAGDRRRAARRFDFSGNLTGTPGYAANAWNQYAGFLLGLTSSATARASSSRR